jgi:uncharacterized lipoprotein YmbA
MKPSLRLPVLAAALLLSAGCTLLPEARPDPTRFYVLTSTSSPAAGAGSALAVHLRPIEVAGYLRNRPMVVRRGASEIEFREHARWGEPLEQGIARVLAAELRARGVNVVPAAAGVAALTLRVHACEGGADGTVLFRATWELAGGAAPVAGEFSAQGLRWDGKSEGSLATQLSLAVATLAEEAATGVSRKP